MKILAVDSTTAGGSVALLVDGRLVETVVGDPNRSHGERLANDIAALLERHRLEASAIELFAVAAGPGSYTGLRIGLATIQGLALVNGRLVVPVSALDALAAAAMEQISPDTIPPVGSIGVWMDAQRLEVFSARYTAPRDGNDRRLSALRAMDRARSELPTASMARWADDPPAWMVGGGVSLYRSLIARSNWKTMMIEPVPVLAPVIARIASEQASTGAAIHPGDLRPIYLRRSDAELARERRDASPDPAPRR